jgi:NO-binding membrane sensor protein with MHYT domain/signal transduction histidine kinase
MDHSGTGPVLSGTYDYFLVCLSVVISILAAHAALELAQRVSSGRREARVLWLIGGATAMGFGIWSMHYIGMLAFVLPIPVRYDWPTVVLSLIAAIFASAVALLVVSRRAMSFADALIGSVLMGGGIATMHFVGMKAMRMQAICSYSPFLWALSVCLAIAISFAALWITFHLRQQANTWSWARITGAIVMGMAITVMHYTGMAAATFTASGAPQGDLSHAVNVSSLSVAGIAIVTFAVLGTVLLASSGHDSQPSARRLATRYFVSLGAIGVLAIAGILVIQHQGRQAKMDAGLINLAGRQRMLSQAIAKYAVLLGPSQDATERQRAAVDLRETVDLWEQSQAVLLSGSRRLDQLNADKVAVQSLLEDLEPHFSAMAASARRLVARVASDPAQAGWQDEVTLILGHEKHFVKAMDSIVVQYASAARERVAQRDRLHFSLLLLILGGLLVQGLLVLRPALLRIQRGIRQLQKAQLELHRKATFIELLRLVASAANQASSIDAALQLSIDQICKRTGWPVGHVYLPAPGTDGVLNPSELWHLKDTAAFKAFREATMQMPMERGAGLPGRVAQSGKPAWIPDINADPDFPRLKAALDLGVRGAFAFPVLTQGEVAAVLEFFSSEIEEPDDELLTIMAHVGVQLGLLIERKRAQARLAQKADELARSNAELEQFAYVASHDLQEPLRMVASYTQLLARRYEGKLDADADQFIAFAVDGATRMQTLIRDLLSYSRVTSKAGSFQSVSADASARIACENLRKSIEEASAVVDIGSLPEVLADSTQLIQLFQNLIGNAIKYRDDRRPEIRVDASPNERGWTFSVRDNGIGMEPRYFEQIFQMFQRLHTRERFSGTGIGLAICRKIVERHGGKIWVESALGKGSTFLFTIPQV